MIEIPQFIKEYVEKCIDKVGRVQGAKQKKYITEEISNWLVTNNLNLVQVKFLINNGLSEIPTCLNCGKRLTSFECGHKYCSIKCASSSEIIKAKVINTEKEKYGSHHMNTSKSKEALKHTCIKKYGVDNYTKTKESREKFSNLWKNRSDEEINEIKEKIKQTCIKKYGVENISQTNNWKENIKNTSIKNYGVSHPMKSEIVKNILKESNKEKYGCESYFQTDEFKQAMKTILRTKNYELNKSLLLSKRNICLLSTKEEYVTESEHKYKCNICNTEFSTTKTNVQKVICPTCICKHYSLKEKEVLEYIKSIYSGEIIENDRNVISPKELDIYVPEKKLAFEFNGTYWHSIKTKPIEYHQEKTLDCQKKGIRLIHIFEYEWDFQQDKIKSIINSAFGTYSRKLYARNCTIEKIDSKTYKEFLDINHLQKSVNSSIRFGLFYKDELVSVIGFGKSRFKKDEFELHRFCNKMNYLVIGSFSKLFKHSDIARCTSYVDLAHFNGNTYKLLGFKEEHLTLPNYKWVNENQYFNRFATQKHKLSALLEEYYPELTEIENMLMNGYEQVFDAGNLKLSYKK